MADPKYADLPGIAYDQQDIYETSDLPEADQANLDAPVEENDSIERTSLNSLEAYDKFKGKVLDSSRADFSDHIGFLRRHGYDAVSGEYEMAAENAQEPETPQQKYQRLQHEMNELLKDVDNLKTKAKSDDPGVLVSATTLAKQAEALHGQLQNVKLEELLGADVVSGLSDPRGLLQKKLLAELENFKQKAAPAQKHAKTGSESGSQPVAENQIVYELHYRPDVAKFNQNTKVAELDERLRKLETVLGSDIDKVATLAGDTNHRSVLGAVSVLNSKLNLLDASHLEQVDTHLAALSLRLAQLAEKRTVVEDADKLSKVSELYDLIKKNEELCAELPAIVDRLVILEDLHKQALQFSTALAQLDSTQQQVSASLKNNQDLLKGVQHEFSTNMEVIKGNIASLDARLGAIKK